MYQTMCAQRTSLDYLSILDSFETRGLPVIQRFEDYFASFSLQASDVNSTRIIASLVCGVIISCKALDFVYIIKIKYYKTSFPSN